MAKTYKQYQIKLRKEEDAALIDYVESQKQAKGTTEIFREALEKFLEG